MDRVTRYLVTEGSESMIERTRGSDAYVRTFLLSLTLVSRPKRRWIPAFAHRCSDKARRGANATGIGLTVPAGHTPPEAYS